MYTSCVHRAQQQGPASQNALQRLVLTASDGNNIAEFGVMNRTDTSVVLTSRTTADKSVCLQVTGLSHTETVSTDTHVLSASQYIVPCSKHDTALG